MKYSIIIPVYNVCDYLDKCLESIYNQTYDNFELIIVNDGSTDNSEEIIKKFEKKHKNIKYIKQKHKGVSNARNVAVKRAKGDYIIFVDSDDYIEKKLLEKINESLINNPDIVRYQIQTVNNETITKFNEIPFENINGIEAFELITNYHFVENVWCLAIKRDYYIKNDFKFKENTLHEDFGLTPLIIIKANIVNSIDYIGYDYVRRNNSIMTTTDYDFIKRKVNDFYNHYLDLKNSGIQDKVFLSFITNSIYLKICELNTKEYKEYNKKLKDLNAYNDLLEDSYSRKIKKNIIKISPRLCMKLRRK